MALFVCSWMLVLGTYANPTETSLSGLAGDVASFLEIYIGGLLVLEGQNPQKRAPRVSWPQSAGLTLLLFIALPRAIDFPAPLADLTNYYLGLTHLTAPQAQALVSLGLTLVAFLALAIGVAHIANVRSPLFGIFAANLLFYSGLQIGDTLTSWSGEKLLTAPYFFGFAAAKLVEAITFGLIVRQRALSVP